MPRALKKTQKKAFLTGISGQDGSYLAELLLDKGYDVHGLVRRSSTTPRARLEHLHPERFREGLFKLHYGDLADSSNLRRLIREIEPDEVYNLAAQSHVRISFDMPEYTMDVTGLGTLRLLEAIRQSGKPARFYQASSSEMFGDVTESPQNEKTPFNPRSPYGIAKVLAHNVTKNYREAYNMYAVSGIMFNHESERRGENFVTRKITLAIAEILAGKRDKLHLGNLESKRDWGYAPEYVEAMWLMLQQNDPDDYVIATGETHSIREFLDTAFGWAGITNWKKYVEIDPHFYRPTEVDVLVGDARKARRILGWKPKVTFEELARRMLEHDCKQLGITTAKKSHS